MYKREFLVHRNDPKGNEDETKIANTTNGAAKVINRFIILLSLLTTLNEAYNGNPGVGRREVAVILIYVVQLATILIIYRDKFLTEIVHNFSDVQFFNPLFWDRFNTIPSPIKLSCDRCC